jgi:hypothetical protein
MEGSECSNESDELVAIDASARNILKLPNIGAPYTLSLIDSCILDDETSTVQKDRGTSKKQETPKSVYSMSSFSSASFELRDC